MDCDFFKDRSWMYKYKNGHEWVNSPFIVGVDCFLEFSYRKTIDGGSQIYCPCSKCENKFFHKRDTVKLHILKEGFIWGYNTWTYHGESWKRPRQNETIVNELTCNMEGMINDVCGPHMQGRIIMPKSLRSLWRKRRNHCGENVRSTLSFPSLLKLSKSNA